MLGLKTSGEVIGGFKFEVFARSGRNINTRSGDDVESTNYNESNKETSNVRTEIGTKKK
jgi:hypothetical protein